MVWLRFTLLLQLAGAALGSKGFSKPAIGFNTCNICCGNATFPNAAFVLGTAAAMMARGFDKAGWCFVNMDDGWSQPPNPAGTQVPYRSKFPKGLKGMIDELHSMGFKAGVYTALATDTCGHHAGSCNHESANAAAYATWGVDCACCLARV